MNKVFSIKILLWILAFIFSVALIFATIELPHVFDRLIQSKIDFPGFDHKSSTFHLSKSELYIQHYHIKELGYLCLFIVFVFIVLGFVTDKLKLSIVGAFVLFLPVFGHFTATMFFLAGLGFLRFIWVPFNDISPILMHLGDVILLPHKWIVSLGRFWGVDLTMPLAIFLIICGILLFVFGVCVWINSKFNNGSIATDWIYKFTRHPQYLGWILWTYGFFIIPVESQKRTWEYPDSLPLLLTIMIILAISFFEELKMSKKYGAEYNEFKSKTCFMLPLNAFQKKIIKHPIKLFFNSWHINSKIRIIVFIVYYTVLLMFTSYVYLGFAHPEYSSKLLSRQNETKIESYIIDLSQSENRRDKDIAAMNLSDFGEMAAPYLIQLIAPSDFETNNFVIRTLGETNSVDACPTIKTAYLNGNVELSYEVIMALGKLKCPMFEQELINEIIEPGSKVKSYAAWYLGQIESQKAAFALVQHYPANEKYTQIAYLEAMGNIKNEIAIDLLIQELSNPEKQIVEASIVSLGQMQSKEAVEPLSLLTKHNDWEIRIYATETLKKLN